MQKQCLGLSRTLDILTVFHCQKNIVLAHGPKTLFMNLGIEKSRSGRRQHNFKFYSVQFDLVVFVSFRYFMQENLGSHYCRKKTNLLMFFNKFIVITIDNHQLIKTKNAA